MKSVAELQYVIQKCDKAFSEPIHERDIYSVLTDKLFKNAKVLVAYEAEILGYCAFYCNDSNSKIAYISLIAVDKTKQNKHIGKGLLKRCEDVCISNGMRYLDLEVMKNNDIAIIFYKNNGFNEIREQEVSYIMRKNLA